MYEPIGATMTESTTGPVIAELVRQLRANAVSLRAERVTDEVLLAPYVLDAQQRRRIAIIGDPDRAALVRLELFYNAIALAVERETGAMVTPVIKMHPEGFGRVLLVAGRLVILSKYLRDVHRFGFDSLEALARQGDSIVSSAANLIRRFPQMVDYEET